MLYDIWGKDWFERGCLSTHFLNMVFEGEKVRAFVERPEPGATRAKCWAEKEDGTPVLEASATLGPDHGETLLEARMASGEFQPGEVRARALDANASSSSARAR